MDLRDAAWKLYGAPLSSFMAERSRLAAEARTAGDTALAKRLTALRKPTVAAWVLNIAVRDSPGLLDEIAELGAALRTGSRAGDEALRELGTERRRLVGRGAAEAASAAEARDTAVSEAVRRDLEASIQAAVIDQGAEVALRSGLLVRTLSASGLDAVDVTDAVALPEVADEAREAQGAPDAEVIEFRPRERSSEKPGGSSAHPKAARASGGRTSAADTEAAAAAREEAAARRRAAAQEELDEARHELDGVRGRLRELGAERERLEAEIDDLTEQLEGAREDLARVDRERGSLRKERTRSERAVTDAERRLARER